MRSSSKTLIQSSVIISISSLIGIATNGIRKDGIPLVATTPYEIFTTCKDSEASSSGTTADDLVGAPILYVDARTSEEFASVHMEGAINLPYSVLFGASKEGVAKVKDAAKKSAVTSVVVYGLQSSPDDPTVKTDLAKPLAEQLIEAGIPGVKHVAGGLDALNKTTPQPVKPK